ncbi:pirin family protein [Treponema primitia]|uniref:pirin family protein n=1 Tax=Treponema primitia TaxID=88058 RepID=UPI0002554DDF|nr:pirin family protein [Treponema primitia]
MLRYIDHTKMGRGIHGWLDSHFHFSFADYYNPENIQFGILRVINDDMVEPGMGFDTHPHENMEIISYVVDGELTHGDSMGNKKTLTRGQVQYMSAGTGVQHLEYNLGKEGLRFLQVWIFPDKIGYKPNYGDCRFNFEDRRDTWLPIASSTNNEKSKAPIRIHADINAYATIVSKGKSLTFEVAKNRQAYLVLVEGSATVNDVQLSMRDAVEITEENITLHAGEDAHALIIEMAKA